MDIIQIAPPMRQRFDIAFFVSRFDDLRDVFLDAWKFLKVAFDKFMGLLARNVNAL